jgi:hypothetical protein
MIRFRVTRTSDCSVNEQQPSCEEAFQDGEGWFLLIENLEALEKFIRKYGDVVISMTEKTNFLEIYDDYRE